MSKRFTQTVGLMATASTILVINQLIYTSWVWQTLNLFVLSIGIYIIYSSTKAIKEKQFWSYADFFALGLGATILGTTNILIKPFFYSNEINFIGLGLLVLVVCYELIVFASNFIMSKPQKNEVLSLKVVETKPFSPSIFRGETING